MGQPTRIGRYQVLGEAARGEMGVVYRGRDPASGEQVALKLLLAGHANEAQRRRFQREAQALARLELPGIVRHALRAPDPQPSDPRQDPGRDRAGHAPDRAHPAVAPGPGRPRPGEDLPALSREEPARRYPGALESSVERAEIDAQLKE